MNIVGEHLLQSRRQILKVEFGTWAAHIVNILEPESKNQSETS